MRILFTGGSSFTGFWFARELGDRGHDVVATFRRKGEGEYQGLRAQRVAEVARVCRPVWDTRFGDDRFLGLLEREGPWDLLCHHGAEVGNYKDPGFDVVSALAANTHGIQAVLDGLRRSDGAAVLVTGSVFEPGEGAGSEGLEAFSPYGLAKSFTARIFRYYAIARGLRLGKFVIPNPFGAWEEPRFTAYLVGRWREGKPAVVKTPAYVRDNIHVSLLAKVYAEFAEGLPSSAGFSKINPSGYVESQGAFALRFARELRDRLGLECEVRLERQREFPEPRVRINTDVPDAEALGWDEGQAWDAIADFYRADPWSGRERSPGS